MWGIVMRLRPWHKKAKQFHVCHYGNIPGAAERNDLALEEIAVQRTKRIRTAVQRSINHRVVSGIGKHDRLPNSDIDDLRDPPQKIKLLFDFLFVQPVAGQQSRVS
jgi:hypothetical protein